MPNQPHPNQEIFESLDALDDYLLGIRTRREQRREVQLEIKRLLVAIGKVTAELEAAREEGDEEITLELLTVLQEFEARLERTRLAASEAVVYTPPASAVEPSPTEQPEEAEPPVREELNSEISASAVSSTALEETHGTAPQSCPLVRSEDEIEALNRTWLTRIEGLTERWNALDKEGLRQKDNFLNRPACFRMRALASSLASIQSQSDEMGLLSQIVKPVTALRDKMEVARTYAGDTYDSLPFDPIFRTSEGAGLTEDAWHELTSLYENVADGQEAFDWYIHAREEASGGSLHALVNAIGANQQMLFRALGEYGGTDRLQGDLYGALRDAAGSVGFLAALDARTPWEELVELGQTLPIQLQSAKKEVEAVRARQAKEAAKTAAIESVIRWKDGNGKAGSPASVAAIRAELLPLLDVCAAAGVPATNVQVRGAILEVAPIALQGLSQYRKFLEAVLGERKRKGLDLVVMEDPECLEEDDIPDSQIAETKALLTVFAEGQKVLILGGSARPQVAERLKSEIQCADVEWIDSKKGDRMSKFKRDITHSDIVIVLKKFASHEMTDKGRDWSKEFGKLFVLLPGGYGVNQIINQMYLQLVQAEGSKKADCLIPRSGGKGIADMRIVQ